MGSKGSGLRYHYSNTTDLLLTSRLFPVVIRFKRFSVYGLVDKDSLPGKGYEVLYLFKTH